MSRVHFRPHFDGAGRIAIEHVQDVEPFLEHNQHLRGEAQRSDWGRHVASIPNVVYVKWLDEEHAKGRTDLRMFTPEFDEVVQRKLQDPEWKYLRTDSAQVQGFMGFGD